MENESFNYQTYVLAEWIDYNGHMNDAAYAKAFSKTAGAFLRYIELDEAAREKYAYTTFTLETHLCHLMEANEGEQLTMSGQLVDVDDKRLHLFFQMKNNRGDLVATTEKMIMGMDTIKNKPAPFPAPIAKNIERVWQKDKQLKLPKQVGQKLGIRRK